MEIKIYKKFALTLESMKRFTLFIACICLSAAFTFASECEELDPLDLMSAELSDVNDANSVSQPDLRLIAPSIEDVFPQAVSIAPANLLAKVEDMPDLQSQLQQLISKINSVEFKPIQPAPKQAIVLPPAENSVQQQPQPEPNKIDTAAKNILAADAPDGRQLSEHTIKLLDQLFQKPEQIPSPLQLADVLFRCSKYHEAAICYQQALERIDPNNKDSYTDEAWILFQVGNCLQKTDPQTSLKMFNRLIIQHPDSPWAQAAKVKSDLIDLYVKEKIDTFIDKKNKGL